MNEFLVPLACFVAGIFLPAMIVAKTPTVESMNTLYLFTGDEPSNPWRSNNDGVMGGISKGSAELVAEGMRFSGVLSLENNGGFASVYTRADSDLSEAYGIWLKVMGDGRTYQLRLEGDALYHERWPVSFSSEFTTIADEWMEVFIPFEVFKQTWRGRQLSGYALSQDDIRRIGIMLADGQPGSFNLKVAWLKAE
jgi:monofunctional biosynthetic peptidoglycan transglycosylase